MGHLVCSGAMMMCSFGVAPSTFQATPSNVSAPMMNAGTIMDNKPMTNIFPFGMCSSILNPQVAAATTAAMGVLTPQPCIPATVAPWIIGQPNVMVGTFPALTKESILICNWLGIIQIQSPGQFKVQLQFPSGMSGGGVDIAAKIASVQAEADQKSEEKEKEINKDICVQNLQKIKAAQEKVKAEDEDLKDDNVRKHLEEPEKMKCPANKSGYMLSQYPPRCPAGNAEHKL